MITLFHSLLIFTSVSAFVPNRIALFPKTTALFDAASTTIVKRLPNSAVEIHIPVPGTATQAAYDKVCTELSKTIQIPGFRKGSKIPPQVLEQNMAAKGGRNALKVQAIQELLGQLVEPAFKEQSLDPIGQPTLQTSAEELADSFQPGEPLTLPVQCDVWPEIQWQAPKAYIGLKGKYTRKPFNQERMDKALSDLKERYAELTPIQDPNHVLQLGDACTVNMQGFFATADGEKGDPLPSAASGDRVEVVLGPGRYMEGLVEGLIGAKVGDTVTVTVSFPEVSLYV
jgi:trigger factor